MGLRRTLSDPKTWVKVHGGLALTWALLTVPALLWWRESVAFVVVASVYANFAGSVASWQAAKADQNSVGAADLERVEQKIDAMRGRINLLTRGR